MPIEMGSYVELKDVSPDQEVSLDLLAECLGALPLDLVLEMCARANQIASGPAAIWMERERSPCACWSPGLQLVRTSSRHRIRRVRQDLVRRGQLWS